MLDRYPVNAKIDHATDHSDLCALIERYDMAINELPTKIGNGVRAFEKRANRGQRLRDLGCFVEIINQTARVFLPVGDMSVMGAVLKSYPAQDLCSTPESWTFSYLSAL